MTGEQHPLPGADRGGPLDVGGLPPQSPPGPGPLAAGVVPVPAGRHEALLALPAADGPVPLLVFFHGSGGDARQSLDLLAGQAGRHGVAVLAPRSTDYSWDVVVGAPGPDVAALRRALVHTVRQVRIDPGAVCFGGFSDGASYALTLGLANPATVQAVTAFSPGFVLDGEAAGRPAPGPRCFVAHGTADAVLPIERTSRRIVPRLRGRGLAVEHLEFTGRHEVPADVVERALLWWLGPRADG